MRQECELAALDEKAKGEHTTAHTAASLARPRRRRSTFFFRPRSVVWYHHSTGKDNNLDSETPLWKTSNLPLLPTYTACSLWFRVSVLPVCTKMSGSSLPSGTGLQTMMVAAFAFIVFAIVALYYLFTQMDLSRTVEFSDKLELTENSPDQNPSTGVDESTPQRRYLTQYRRIVLMLTVGIITILVYLILVFSNAPLWLEWIGMLIILVLLGPILQYGDEIRRQRYDRISLMVTLIFVLAMGLNLAVYAANQYADEDIYKGPARIIDYQDDNYNNAEGETVTRTDLMVAWGGPWGCPHNPGQYCEAAVPGALCDSSFYTRRQLEDGTPADDQYIKEQTEAGNQSASNGSDGTEDTASSYAQLQQDYKDLEQQYEDLQDKYDTLQQQNQELQYDLVSAYRSPKKRA